MIKKEKIEESFKNIKESIFVGDYGKVKDEFSKLNKNEINSVVEKICDDCFFFSFRLEGFGPNALSIFNKELKNRVFSVVEQLDFNNALKVVMCPVFSREVHEDIDVIKLVFNLHDACINERAINGMSYLFSGFLFKEDFKSIEKLLEILPFNPFKEKSKNVSMPYSFNGGDGFRFYNFEKQIFVPQMILPYSFSEEKVRWFNENKIALPSVDLAVKFNSLIEEKIFSYGKKNGGVSDYDLKVIESGRNCIVEYKTRLLFLGLGESLREKNKEMDRFKI